MFHRLLLLALASAVLGPGVGRAQTLDLTSQSQVNAASSYTVADSIYVHGNDIVDLTPLSGITTVAGGLNIFSNPQLASLEGLHNITSVGPIGVFVYQNPALANLDGLRGLTTVGDIIGDLEVRSNGALANLDGLRNLTLVGGNLDITNNAALTRFCGLQPLLANNGLRGWSVLASNGQSPTVAQIIAAGPCGSFAHLMSSGCSFGRQLALTGSHQLGGTITATMTGHNGVPFVTWGFGPPNSSWTYCACAQVTVGSRWQYTSSISLTVPASQVFLGMPLLAQGLDFVGSTGAFCTPFPNLWFAFTDIQVATIGV
ncbi:MAG: hypothetical protein NXI31_15370 [bacterium]|nr:hypothetical protein [bacterium]